MVRSLAEHMAQQTIAALGNRAAVLFTAARRFGRNDTRVRHQLGRGSKAAQAADFGHDGHRTQKADAAKPLQCSNQRDLRAGLSTLTECGLESFDALPGGGDFSQIIGKDHAVCQMLELEQAQPLKVAFGPVPHADWWLCPLSEQELAQAMFRAQFIDFGIRSRADQIPQRLMFLVGYPHRREITTSQQPRQFEGVATIGFTLSPGRTGMSEGAATRHSMPSFVNWRCRAYPVGPASEATRSCTVLPPNFTISLRIDDGSFGIVP
jgi:hypothetical protein